jgi:hypothetical protein
MKRVSLLISCAALASKAIAEEAPARVQLEWHRGAGSEGCIGASELESLVTAQLGRQVFGDARAELLIQGSIERVVTPPGWRATLIARRPDATVLGTRELVREAADCRELDRALALVVALSIDRDASLGVVGAAPQTLPTAVRPPRAAIRAAPRPTPRREWRLGAALGALGAVGLLPSPSVAIAAAIVVDPRRLPAIEISGSSWLEREERSAGGGARVDLVAAGLAMCPAFPSLRGLGACAGIDVGRMRGEGFGFSPSQSQSETMAQARLVLRLELPLTAPVFVRVAAGASIPLIRPRFYVTDGMSRREVFQSTRVAGVGGLDVFVEF